ncbi:unnamed protein product [Staurois parvus]|uniref:Uncharacterized protein n=1 Tax=Staurois parvus TaxID=386267 RepID=A0ABN9DGT0_9NEOB|nr:unnamed protein product [Staurois parvus]
MISSTDIRLFSSNLHQQFGNLPPTDSSDGALFLTLIPMMDPIHPTNTNGRVLVTSTDIGAFSTPTEQK